jgi:hypothetical protein
MKWDDLPEHVRTTIEDQTGPIMSTDTANAGDSADMTAVLGTDRGPVFVKAVHGDGRRARWLRNEHSAGHLTAGIAPRPAFACEVDGWLAVGFEYIAGRPADLTPASPDLPCLTTVLDDIAHRPGSGLHPLSHRWADTSFWDDLKGLPPGALPAWDLTAAATRASDISSAVAGDRLIHTDLHSEQFIVRSERVWVVDWSWPAQGAPWVDAAFMVIRLIGAGHTPQQAEQWAARLDCWTGATDALDAFACHVAGLWSLWAVRPSSRAARNRATWARAYATWRVTGHSGPPDTAARTVT